MIFKRSYKLVTLERLTHGIFFVDISFVRNFGRIIDKNIFFDFKTNEFFDIAFGKQFFSQTFIFRNVTHMICDTFVTKEVRCDVTVKKCLINRFPHQGFIKVATVGPYFLRSEKKKRIDFDQFLAKIDGVLRKLYKKQIL